MTTLSSEALPPVADGETPYTPWQDIDVRSSLYRQYRVWLTPEGAREWMTHNLLNRPINPATLRAIRRAIRRGELLLGQDAVGFCAADGVISGAHRMLACIQEDMPIEVAVAVGLAQKVRWVADTHTKRSVSQNLGMMGYKNAKVLGSLAMAVWRLEEFGQIRKGGGAPEAAQVPELHELIEQYPRVERFAEIAYEVYWKLGRKETPTVLGLALWMMAKGSDDPGAAIEFMRQLAYAPAPRPLAVATEEDEPPTPAALLRRRLTQAGYTKAGKTDLTRVTQIIEAWNAWVSGDSEWAPPFLEQAASVPKPLYPGNEYPLRLMVPEPDAKTWSRAA